MDAHVFYSFLAFETGIDDGSCQCAGPGSPRCEAFIASTSETSDFLAVPVLSSASIFTLPTFSSLC